ncbi:MAG: LptF/LptG family permease [Gemmatimonadaceae bacterium]|nr:LptF/LptG family permease [Gemmatimonadaceae bacterium]
MSVVRPLDRYVFTEFWKIFIATALGFPLLLIVFDVTDNLDKYLAKNLPASNIALSYLYGLPESMFLILPAAVLFATVFSIGAFTRHSEITAAKASGISFYRFIAPIFLGAVIASASGLVLGELAPRATKRKLDLLESQTISSMSQRYNFAYSADAGRVYKVQTLHVQGESIDGMTIERRGKGPSYPSYIVAANQAVYRDTRGWKLLSGTMHVLTDSLTNITYAFDSLRDRRFVERPKDLMLTPKAPADMDFRELGQFIQAMERSGADVNELRVERMLKIVIPITSIVILMFAASLATSTQRGGAAYGIGLSLGTTVIFMFLIQVTKALGGNGLVSPELAAWMPSILFGVMGAILFARVRT